MAAKKVDEQYGSRPLRLFSLPRGGVIPLIRTVGFLALSSALLGLSGCGTAPLKSDAPRAEKPASSPQAKPPRSAKGGGYYLDDGPGDNPPENLDDIPDAEPRAEPLNPYANRPYTALGRSYTPMTRLTPYKERGIATWYGKRYHGQKTSSGEIYDMYGMTAAHPTLPLPSFARVTNVRNNKSVIVRVNDRGPFYPGRVVDLSYTAAYKLGVLSAGSSVVEVESILPGSNPATTVAVATSTSSSTANQPAESISPTDKSALETTQVLTTTPADTGGAYVVQLGAFTVQDNAETFLAKMRLELAWLGNTLQLLNKDGLYRVHAGPYVSKVAAQQVVDRIGRSLGLKPVITVR